MDVRRARLSVVAGVPLATAALVAATIVALKGAIAPRGFVLGIFPILVASDVLALQLDRRGVPRAALVAALAAALGTVALFGAMFVELLYLGSAVRGAQVWALLVVAPAGIGLAAAAGAAWLGRGVRRHRAIHGMVHAPPR